MRILRAALIALSATAIPFSASAQSDAWTLPKSDFGGATPLNPERWMTFQDYPAASIRKKEQGYVMVSFEIDAKGKVTDCVVSRSSGYSRLDEVPCRLLKRRARFRPAVDSDGSPRATHGITAMSFRLPD